MRMSVRALGVLAACACGMAAGQVTQQSFVTGIDRPVFLTYAPGEPDKLFVLEQEGAIRIIENGVLLPTPFMDIDGTVIGGDSGGSEQGLLGLAFAPDYETSGRFFVHYVGTSPTLGTVTAIAEYRRDDTDPTGRTADVTSGQVLLEIDQPFSNHNGGWLGFGPDGYLYAATGDGGSGNDPQNNASRLVNLLGKMLRIDVSTPGTYTVPADNPFTQVFGAQPEIWSYGLRNPWRSSFDTLTGDLWIADVGQGAREEINLQPASSTGGEHYGWRCREGSIENPAFSGCTPTPPTGFTEPIYDYVSVGRCSVVGGYVYRGCAIPELEGLYIWGDYCTGEVIAIDPNAATITEIPLFNFGFGLSSFGMDQQGELYVMDVQAGFINKLVPTNPIDDNGNGIPDGCEEVPCLADVNGNGETDPGDFTAWVTAYNSGDLAADQNQNGELDPGDFTAWVTNYNAGC
ncbi:MAG: PQQ-dependent sugar dehydrogenase [Phycisphaerales bacterium]